MLQLAVDLDDVIDVQPDLLTQRLDLLRTTRTPGRGGCPGPDRSTAPLQDSGRVGFIVPPHFIKQRIPLHVHGITIGREVCSCPMQPVVLLLRHHDLIRLITIENIRRCPQQLMQIRPPLRRQVKTGQPIEDTEPIIGIDQDRFP